MSFPKGHLTLSYCPACAFCANTRYDETVQHYSTQCEESQHVSPTFNKFAHSLAQPFQRCGQPEFSCRKMRGISLTTT